MQNKFQIPHGWTSSTLSKECEIKIGGTPRRNVPEYWNGDNPWVSIADMNKDIIVDTKEKITDIGVTNSNVKLISQGTILLSFKLTIGKAVKAGIDLYTNEAITALEIKNHDRLFEDYLMYFLRWFDIKQYAHDAAKGKSLNSTTLASIPIYFPEIQKQQKIVEILKTISLIKQKRNHTRIVSKKLISSIFTKIFGNPELNPKNWPKKQIQEIADVGTGGTPRRSVEEYYSGTIPWVKTAEAQDNIILKTEEGLTQLGLENSNARIFPIGTILVAMYGQGKTRGKTAKLGIPAATNQAFAAILPSKNHETDYLWHFLQNSYNFLRKMARGGNQPNLNLGMIKSLQIPLPSLKLQQEFSYFAKKYAKLNTKLKNSEARFMALSSSLTEKAFRGELV